MKKENYKDFVYLKIPKDEFKRILKLVKEKGRKAKVISIDDLLRYELLYRMGIENKQDSAMIAHKYKKSKKDIQIYNVLENYYTSTFRYGLERLSAYKLSKLAKINYRTAKRFWEDYNLDYWIKEFERRGSETLKEFKIQELAESFVWGK